MVALGMRSLVALALLAGACVVSTELADGAFLCRAGEAGACPEGLVCAPDGRCRAGYTTSTGGDGGGSGGGTTTGDGGVGGVGGPGGGTTTGTGGEDCLGCAQYLQVQNGVEQLCGYADDGCADGSSCAIYQALIACACGVMGQGGACVLECPVSCEVDPNGKEEEPKCQQCVLENCGAETQACLADSGS